MHTKTFYLPVLKAGLLFDVNAGISAIGTLQNATVWGWGDGAVGKVFATNACGLQFDPQHPCES